MTDAKIYHRFMNIFNPGILLRLTTITTLFLTHGARYIDILSSHMGVMSSVIFLQPDARANVVPVSFTVPSQQVKLIQKKDVKTAVAVAKSTVYGRFFWETLRRNG